MFEHKSENGRVKGRQMTILDTREIQAESVFRPVGRPGFRPGDTRRRPRSNRPGGAPLRYRGTGVLMSRASHRRRPITPATTVVLALIAAGITVWLGLVAQFGGVTGGDAPVPGRLAVIQVQTGESLQQWPTGSPPTRRSARSSSASESSTSSTPWRLTPVRRSSRRSRDRGS